MRAALARPRRHRGTENATIAERFRVGDEITCNCFDSTAIDTPPNFWRRDLRRRLRTGRLVGYCLAPPWCRSPADERKSSSSLPPWVMGMIAAPWMRASPAVLEVALPCGRGTAQTILAAGRRRIRQHCPALGNDSQSTRRALSFRRTAQSFRNVVASSATFAERSSVAAARCPTRRRGRYDRRRRRQCQDGARCSDRHD